MKKSSNAPRHTARQIADDVAAGMDPDAEGVAAQYYDAAMKRIAELEAIGVNLQQQAAEHHQAKLEAERLLLASAEETRRIFNGLLAAHAELARVKAESLRVVELPLDYEFMSDWYMTPTGLGWNGNDRHGDSCVETPDDYYQFRDCNKVRLERWEKEE